MPFDLPPQAGAARDASILKHIDRGDFQARWVDLHVAEGGHTAVFHVMGDALSIGGVRINVSADLEQRIADKLGASLLTPKLADRLWIARNVTITPQIGEVTSSTDGMVKRSKMVSAAAAKAGYVQHGVLQTVGKHWVISNALERYAPGTKAENYGWHFEGATLGGSSFEPAVTPGLRVVQGQGWAHPPQHTDASQTCVLVKKDCIVDGRHTTLARVLSDPALAPLASHEGVVRVLRQPGTEESPLLSKFIRGKRLASAHAFTLTSSTVGAILGGPIGGLAGMTVGLLIDSWRANRE